MPSFERGVYEPPSDDIHVFDEDENIDEEGSRLPLLIVIALLVLAAFAGVVWLAYSQGVQRGRSDAPRMIVAASGPDKEIATNSNAGSTTDLKIYQQPAPADEVTDASPLPSQTSSAKATAPQPVPRIATPQPPPTVTTSRTTMKSAVVTKPAPPKLVVIEKPKPPVVVQTQPASSTVTIAPAAPVPTNSSSAAGSYVLQIGAYKSQSDADTAWKAYKAKHSIVGSYSEDVQKADLGDKGTWYRLRIGSFSDKASATALCDKLKADSGNCFLAK
ncbi:MAG TPA: SPOR domain-containing protein [Rhizomicrobium sp.]|jgi:cell division protein FtsN|nr:SPOR domain-containing protein [Rhizomicrobium sp.]